LRSRLKKHNAGEVAHTSKHGPWMIKTYVAFSDEKQAFVFEKYLKSASGRAFAKKRL
jgi:putative endonuclease